MKRQFIIQIGVDERERDKRDGRNGVFTPQVMMTTTTTASHSPSDLSVCPRPLNFESQWTEDYLHRYAALISSHRHAPMICTAFYTWKGEGEGERERHVTDGPD